METGYSGTAFWVWVVGLIAWLVVTFAALALQIARVYRTAWAHQALAAEAAGVPAVAATAQVGPSTPGRLRRMRSNSEPDILR